MSALNLPVKHYQVERVPNPYPGGLPWQVYHTVRNAVVRVCKEFGPTGAMGECPIVAGPERPPAGWPLGDNPCLFFVVDDQYNDERYIYLEIHDAAQVSEQWHSRVVDVLGAFPGWGIGLCNIRDGYVLIFADKVMVTGAPFAACRDVDTVLQAVRTSLITFPGASHPAR